MHYELATGMHRRDKAGSFRTASMLARKMSTGGGRGARNTTEPVFRGRPDSTIGRASDACAARDMAGLLTLCFPSCNWIFDRFVLDSPAPKCNKDENCPLQLLLHSPALE